MSDETEAKLVEALNRLLEWERGNVDGLNLNRFGWHRAAHMEEERNEAIVHLRMREAECKWLRKVERAAEQVVKRWREDGHVSGALVEMLAQALKEDDAA